MLTQKEVTATRKPSGAWEISAIVAGYLVCKVYIGYTKRQAVRMYVTEVNAVTARASSRL